MSKKYGYARCSLAEEKGQDLNRQVRELKSAGAEEIITEREHGDAKVKQNLDMLLEVAQPGDTIICCEVSRLSRSTQQLCEIVNVIKQKHMGFCDGKKYSTIYADPPWRFQNRTGKVAPEHKRLNRYDTMSLDEIKALPIRDIAEEKCHLYLWVPNALLPDGLEVMKAWGFEYKGILAVPHIVPSPLNDAKQRMPPSGHSRSADTNDIFGSVHQ